ncbi:MAG: HAD family hydrolase [Endomicrobia bacterium]|nr:HAD family hydrolase [Endomicrobiia bacterium]
MAADYRFPVVFLDRDGTLIVDKVYLNDPDGIEFLEGVIGGLKKLYDLGFKLVIVTNQSGVARKLVDLKNLELIHKNIIDILSSSGVEILDILYCPHLPQDNCECRKPKIGMVKNIIDKIDKNRSFVVGDKESDVEFGKNLGIKAILISNKDNINTRADFVVRNFKEVVDIISNVK